MNKSDFNSNIVRKIIAIYYYQLKMQISYPFATLNYIFLPFYFILPIIIFGTSVYDTSTSSSINTENNLIIYLLLGSTIILFAIRFLHSLTISLRKEMWMGTLSSLYLTPNSILVIIIGYSLSSLSLSVIGIILQFIILSFIYKLSFTPIYILYFCFLNILLSFVMFGIGMIILSLTLTNKQAFYLIGFIEIIMTISTPFAYTINVLPGFLQFFVILNPLTVIMNSARNYFFTQNTSTLIWNFVYFLVLIPVLFCISFFIFSYSQKQLLKSGTVDFF